MALRKSTKFILVFCVSSHDLDTEEFEEFLQKVRQTTYPGGPVGKFKNCLHGGLTLC